jgi:hypothetical protein
MASFFLDDEVAFPASILLASSLFMSFSGIRAVLLFPFIGTGEVIIPVRIKMRKILENNFINFSFHWIISLGR